MKIKNISMNDITVNEIDDKADQEADQRLYVDDSEKNVFENEIDTTINLNFLELCFLPCTVIILLLFIIYRKISRSKLKNKKPNYKK